MHLAAVSDHLFAVTVVIYSLAMLAFAADLAFGRRSTPVPVPEQSRRVAEREPVLAGVGARGGATASVPPGADGGVPLPAGRARRVGAVAVGLTVLGWCVHLAELVTRGLAAHRVPWGNMYEFSSTVAFVAVGAFLVLLWRRQVRWLGLFVLLPVVVYLGLAGTVLFVKAGPLVPALNSYWIKIHVVAAILATGTFMVSGVTTALHLVRRRHDRLVAAGRPPRTAGIVGRLPAAAALDRTTYRIVAFAFPVWTFAIIAGAIWAESAWGRYWGWDPKETWSFITWVIYAGYLHARSTSALRRYAPAVALLGFLALVVNYYVVNTVIVGFHSYAR